MASGAGMRERERENRATVGAVNSWPVASYPLGQREHLSTHHITGHDTSRLLHVSCFASWGLMGTLSGGRSMTRVKTLYRGGSPMGVGSLQRSLHTRLFVVLPHSPSFHRAHYLRTESWRASRTERVWPSARRQILIVSGTQRAVLSVWPSVGQCPGVEEEEDQCRLSSSSAFKPIPMLR